jgi:hypothetical protein
VITRDDRIRYNQLEKQAVLAAKLRFFSITSSSLTGDEAASLILSAVRAMTRLCRLHAADGFIAKISRVPEVGSLKRAVARPVSQGHASASGRPLVTAIG